MRGLIPVISFAVLGAVALALGAYGAQQLLVCSGDKQGCIPGLTVPNNAHAPEPALQLYAYAVVAMVILILVANAMLRVALARRRNASS